MESLTSNRYFSFYLCAVLALLCLGGHAGRTYAGTDIRTGAMMNAAAVEQARIVSADLIPSISDPRANMVVARLKNLRLAQRREADQEVETGTGTFEIVETINSRMLTPGGTIEVPIQRLADRGLRSRNSRNQWNNLRLDTGDFLLLSCRLTSSPTLCEAVAVVSIDSPSSPLVGAVRHCYAIEALGSHQGTKRQRLEAALESGQDLLVFYALDALGRRSVLGREVGADIAARAITNANTPPQYKIEIGGYLTRLYFFLPERHADHANQVVLGALAAGLVEAPDADTRLRWVRYLAATLLSELSENSTEAASIRAALIRGTQTPRPDRVMAALSQVTHHGSTEQQAAKELLSAWQTAWRSEPKATGSK